MASVCVDDICLMSCVSSADTRQDLSTSTPSLKTKTIASVRCTVSMPSPFCTMSPALKVTHSVIIFVVIDYYCFISMIIIVIVISYYCFITMIIVVIVINCYCFITAIIIVIVTNTIIITIFFFFLCSFFLTIVTAAAGLVARSALKQRTPPVDPSRPWYNSTTYPGYFWKGPPLHTHPASSLSHSLALLPHSLTHSPCPCFRRYILRRNRGPHVCPANRVRSPRQDG